MLMCHYYCYNVTFLSGISQVTCRYIINIIIMLSWSDFLSARRLLLSDFLFGRLGRAVDFLYEVIEMIWIKQ